ncbi:MAG: hypothetical protein ACQES9_08895 [Myxococcota bacterium]
MTVKKNLSNNRLLILLSLVAGLVIILAGSYKLSRQKVESAILQDSSVDNETQAVKSSALKELWKNKKIKAPFKPLKTPLPYFKNFKINKMLSVKNPVYQTKNIKVKLEIRDKNYNLNNNDKFLMVLVIENLTSSHLAYKVKVKTKDTTSCISKKSIKLHTFLLKPKQKAERIEGCTFTRTSTVKLLSIQVIKLPKAAFITLSRIKIPLGVASKYRKWHKNIPSILDDCLFFKNIKEYEQKVKKDKGFWYKLMDFYARHDCKTENY